MKRRLFILIFLSLFISCTKHSVPYDFIKEAGGIKEYRLRANDLRVLVYEDRSYPVVSLSVLYRAGSRNEMPLASGAAHFLEHMMFRGTARFNKSTHNSVFELLEAAGGRVNGSTWADRTNFTETFPASDAVLSLALTLEADRMRNILITPGDVDLERSVILNERALLRNDPKALLAEAVWQAAFAGHPYERPVIGTPEDLENMTAESLRAFYDTHYQPNNAYLIVTGDVKPDELLEKINEAFGAISSSPTERKTTHVAEFPVGPTRITVPHVGGTRALLLAHRVPPAAHADSYALAFLSHILTGGRTSRLNKQLLDSGLAASVGAEGNERTEDGLFSVSAAPTGETALEDIEKIILNTYEDIKEHGVTADELAKARSAWASRFAFASDGPEALAAELAEAVSAGDWTYFPTFLEKINAVTAADVQRVVETYFVDERLTVGYLTPSDSPTSGDVVTTSEAKQSLGSKIASAPSEPRSDNMFESDLNNVGHYVKPEKPLFPSLSARVAFENVDGIRLFTLPTSLKNAVRISASFYGAGYAFSGDSLLATITSRMLTQKTEGYAREALAEALERQGAFTSFGITWERFFIEAGCLKDDVALVIETVARQIRRPEFLAEDLWHVKEVLRVEITEEEMRPATHGNNVLSRLIYPSGHPEQKTSYEEKRAELDRISLDDVRAFHQTHYGKNDMIFVASGDMGREAFKQALRSAFSDWETKPIVSSFKTQIEPGGAPAEVIEPIPTATNVFFALGHGVALSRISPDYYAASLANFILGGNYSSRLMATLREREGLVYATQSVLEGTGKEIEGSWQIRFAAASDDLFRAREKTRQVLSNFIESGVTEGELLRAKSIILGGLPVRLASSGALTNEIRGYVELGLGVEGLDQYPDKIWSVSLGETNAAIRRHFHPELLRSVTAGKIPEENK